MINLLINEDEAFIGDFALDTLYTTQDCKLTPIAVQSPSVFPVTFLWCLVPISLQIPIWVFMR